MGGFEAILRAWRDSACCLSARSDGVYRWEARVLETRTLFVSHALGWLTGEWIRLEQNGVMVMAFIPFFQRYLSSSG